MDFNINKALHKPSAIMHAFEKLALERHSLELINDIDCSLPLFIGKCLQCGLLTAELIEQIKAKKTRAKRIQKLLQIIPRRGPHAFDNFINVIKDTYPWLAEKLRKTLNTIKTEPEFQSLKDRVDSYVHEYFGTSKRLCEDDKNKIKQFLYAGIHHYVQDNGDKELHKGIANEKEIEKRTFEQVLKLFHQSDANTVNSECSTDINIDVIAAKVKELNQIIDHLQNVIHNCYEILGLKSTEFSELDDVLEIYKNARDGELTDFNQMKQQLDILEKERQNLEENLIASRKALNDSITNMKNIQNINEQYEENLKDLRAKCEKLEQIHLQHIEKQQTLDNLKEIVKSLNHKKHPYLPQPIKKENSNALVLPHLNHGKQPVYANQTAQRGRLQFDLNTNGQQRLKPLCRSYNSNGNPWRC